MTLIAFILVLMAEEQGAIRFVDSGGDIQGTLLFMVLIAIAAIGDIRRALR